MRVPHSKRVNTPSCGPATSSLAGKETGMMLTIPGDSVVLPENPRAPQKIHYEKKPCCGEPSKSLNVPYTKGWRGFGAFVKTTTHPQIPRTSIDCGKPFSDRLTIIGECLGNKSNTRRFKAVPPDLFARSGELQSTCQRRRPSKTLIWTPVARQPILPED